MDKLLKDLKEKIDNIFKNELKIAHTFLESTKLQKSFSYNEYKYFSTILYIKERLDYSNEYNDNILKQFLVNNKLDFQRFVQYKNKNFSENLNIEDIEKDLSEVKIFIKRRKEEILKSDQEEKIEKERKKKEKKELEEIEKNKPIINISELKDKLSVSELKDKLANLNQLVDNKKSFIDSIIFKIKDKLNIEKNKQIEENISLK